MEILTKSARQTAGLGEKIANQLIISHQSSIIALSGELGSGKTTFVQGLARGLGIKKRVLSPTFILMRQYAIRYMPYANFYHVDLYRVENEKDVRGLGLSEIWSNPENIVAIEWAEKIKKILPKRRWEIYFEYVSDTERRISINFSCKSCKVRP